jgi:hypothetical protein
MQPRRSFLASTALVALFGCGGSSDTPDAFFAPDALGGPDASTTPDAFVETPDAAAGPDAFTPPIYAGLVPNMPSTWEYFGMPGLAGGRLSCMNNVAGSDHPCDYEEVVSAAERGELAAIPMGTTAWLQRTTPVTVDGMEYAPGQGGNCVDWTFNGNHLADGEYITFDAAGVPTYHFDSDTFFDGVDTTRAQPGLLQCGFEMRAILCCHAAP